MALLFVSLACAALADTAVDGVQEVVSGAGKVVSQSPQFQAAVGRLYVFEENHASIRGQVQIATMLTRLYKREGLRNIGLEGALISSAPLPTKTFMQWENALARREALRHMLVDGELRATEYVGAVNPEVSLWGLEKKEEYEVQPPSGVYGMSANFVACTLIANNLLPSSTLQQLKRLLQSGKYEDMIEVMKAGDPWLKEQFTATAVTTTSLEDLLAQNKAIAEKAKSVGVELPQQVKNGMSEMVRFLEVAEKRSSTIVDNMADLAKRFPKQPTALVVGAAHSKRIMEELARRQINSILIQPLNLNPSTDDDGLIAYGMKGKGLLAGVSSNSIGYHLNRRALEAVRTADKRPWETFIGHPTPTRDALGSIQYATSLIAEAARNGRNIPSDIPEVFKPLPGGVSVDPKSFSRSGYDVIFCVVMDDPGKEKRRFWIRAGTVNRPNKTVDADSIKNDEKLLADADGEPPHEPPKGRKASESEGDEGNRKNSGGKHEGPAERKPDSVSAELRLADIEVVAKAFDDQKAATACPMLSTQ